MKTARLLLFRCSVALSCSGVLLVAQAPRHQVQVVDPTPLTARAQGAAAMSTTQTGGARDGEPLRTLPALAATQVDGTTADARSVARRGYWLLLYRGLGCAACDRMLAMLAASEDPALRSGTGLVVLVDSGRNGDSAGAGGNDRLHDLRARYNMLSGTVWLDDRRHISFAALKPRGTPILYAMHGDTIAWSAPGLLGDGRTLTALASAWIAHKDPAPKPADTTTGAGK